MTHNFLKMVFWEWFEGYFKSKACMLPKSIRRYLSQNDFKWWYFLAEIKDGMQSTRIFTSKTKLVFVLRSPWLSIRSEIFHLFFTVKSSVRFLFTGMFGTKYKFATSENNFVTYVCDGQLIFQRISLSQTSFLLWNESSCHEVILVTTFCPQVTFHR